MGSVWCKMMGSVCSETSYRRGRWDELPAGLEKWFQRWMGLGLGAPEEKGPQVSQRAQNHLYNYCNCWKIVQEKKKGSIFVIYWVPLVPTRKWYLWGPEGKVPPGPPSPPRFLRPWLPAGAGAGWVRGWSLEVDRGRGRRERGREWGPRRSVSCPFPARYWRPRRRRWLAPRAVSPQIGSARNDRRSERVAAGATVARPSPAAVGQATLTLATVHVIGRHGAASCLNDMTHLQHGELIWDTSL